MHTCTFIFANFLFYLICSARSEILEFFFQSLLMDSDESFYLDFFLFFYTLWNLKFTYNSKCWMADEMKMLQLILVHEHEIPTKKKMISKQWPIFFSVQMHYWCQPFRSFTLFTLMFIWFMRVNNVHGHISHIGKID